MMMSIETVIDSQVNELAASVLPLRYVEKFQALPLRDKVFGLKFFATMVSDQEVIERCNQMEEVLDRYEPMRIL